jgi:ERCC4-related helicase
MFFTPYHAKYFAYELTKRSSSDSMQKLASTLVDVQAQVDLNPHQVDAALFAFRSPLSKGAILADEVGLGKTIEAGLVISQKWAERKRKILIVAPANLRKQWSQELQDKFFLPSLILEAKSFNELYKAGNTNPFDRHEIVICSYQFIKSKDSYVRGIKWDLAVIDEAHRLRNVYKPNNVIARSIKQALEHAPKILLTATPLQNSLMELYGLVSVIDEFSFGDSRSFKTQYNRADGNGNEDQFHELKERLKPICKRTLRRQVLEYVNYTNRIALVEEFFPTDEEQRLYDLVSDYLQRETLHALPSSQRILMTLILRRLLASSTHAISGTLGALCKKLEDKLPTNANVENEIAADFEVYEELKEEWDEEESEETPAHDQSDAEIASIKDELASLREFETLAKSIQRNSKGEKLITALSRGFAELDRIGAPRKAIIFTESKRTQEYLMRILDNSEYGGKLVLFNGTNNDPLSKSIYSAWTDKYKGTDKVTGSKSADMRAALVEYFRDQATIMIATEAAAEGINLQFCSLLVNYDMPWNPQRIEQRIGRCHRYGQKYDVVVVNFLNKKNEADQRVYELLRDKFNLFNGVFGASDEVLGSIESGVDFEKRIAKIYQDCRTSEEIQLSFNFLQRELEERINTELTQTKQKLLENFDAEVHEKLKINLEESREYLSRYEKWLWNLTKYYLRNDAQFSDSYPAFTLTRNPFEGETIHPGPYRIGKSIDDSNVYRIGHRLAELIINQVKGFQLRTKNLSFDLTKYGKKISALNDLQQKSGWISMRLLAIDSFEGEDHVILMGVTDEGTFLDDAQCRWLFELPAEETETSSDSGSSDVKTLLSERYAQRKSQIIEDISNRNSQYFENELEKLDYWGEDKRSSLKMAMKELDDEIKRLRKEIRLAPNLPEKINLEKQKRKLEAERNDAWKKYDEAAKAIENQKDKLIDEIEQKLQQQISEEEMFLVRWQLS